MNVNIQSVRPNKQKVAIIKYKDFESSLNRLYKLGGRNQKKFNKVASILTGIEQFGADHLEKQKFTNNGESRIKSCIKVDLGDGFRLITQKLNNCVAFLFVGDHEECDFWLNRNKGFIIAHDLDDQTLKPLYKSEPTYGIVVAPEPKPSVSTLLEKLAPNYQKELLDGVPSLDVIRLSQLKGIVTPGEIESVCRNISDPDKMILVQDVLAFLAADNLANANLLLDEFAGRTRTVEQDEASEVMAVQDGDTVRKIVVGSKEYEKWINHFSTEGDHLEWMLFMHPEQQRIVDEDFSGSAQLSGVSGSGKTCIAVKRALRLAESDQNERVLLVTLNKSLAGLIGQLADQAAPNADVRKRIKVTSFFELCQELLSEFEPDRIHYYDSVSWKLDEHIDEVFREFYRCWTNSDSAQVLKPVHRSLVSQGICAENYLREEFDWIRTALTTEQRSRYSDAEKLPRTGRTHPLRGDWRNAILEGLAGWEAKMEAVGVIDYMGLTTALLRHRSKLDHRFTKIIVDEAQDFGTTEIGILRRLVAEGPNDLFLCGDIAQHVLPKHRVLSEAQVDVSGRRRRIERNYRNTKQILEAAYHVLYQNLHAEMLDRQERDLEILDPKYANRSSNAPIVLSASDLEDEIRYARSIVKTHLEQHPAAKCCIAFAGYTACEVERFAKQIGLKALDGSFGFLSESVVLSDLEQTKGYEFDLVVIVNCCKGVLPPSDAPEDEVYRDGCRLYVAMTRAKNDLYLSYHGEPSEWLHSTDEKLFFVKWSDVEEICPSFPSVAPEKIHELEDALLGSVGELDGEQYCYTSSAIGLSHEAQDKICELVDGRGLLRDRKRLKWRSIKDFAHDLEREGRVKAMVGPETAKKLLENLKASI